MERSLYFNQTNSQMCDDMQALIEKHGIARTYPKGSIIYRQGDIADCFFYLKKGRIKVFMNSADGMEKTLSTAAHGEIFGEGAFFDKKPRVSSAKATTASELIIVDKIRLTELIQSYPKLAFELLEILANRIRLLSAQLDSMTFMQADARIAQLLLESETNGKVSLTHEEIATAVGVSRVTVSKTLSRFAKKGCITTEYGYVVIKDREALELICPI
jgi:CRP/FNR family transcriptional regulator